MKVTETVLGEPRGSWKVHGATSPTGVHRDARIACGVVATSTVATASGEGRVKVVWHARPRHRRRSSLSWRHAQVHG